MLPIHARQLVDFAALAASHGPALIVGASRISETCIEQYWLASQARLERWAHGLRSFQWSVSVTGSPVPKAWGLVRPVIEEILVSEILTRVWTAVLSAHDRRRGSATAEPTARSVLLGHLESRRRALALLVDTPGLDLTEAVHLNRLRRRCERWSDVLIGHLLETHNVSEFAVEPSRAREFADDLRTSDQTGGNLAWSLTAAAIRSAFRTGLCDHAPAGEQNARIAQAVLATFPPELFDSTGAFHSLFTVRMLHAASDAAGLVDELLHTGPPVTTWQRRRRARRRRPRTGR